MGNVLATVGDGKLGVSGDGVSVDVYHADVVSAGDYFPGGMTMPGRSYTVSSSTYRYGFNGQEHSTELGGDNYSAQFWEYDSRIGRRWNIEPLTAKYPNLSGYSVLDNNPILNCDPTGDDWIISTTNNKDGSQTVHIKLTVAVINSSANKSISMPALAAALSKQVKNTYGISNDKSSPKIVNLSRLDGLNIPIKTIENTKVTVDVQVEVRVIGKASELNKDVHLVEILSSTDKRVQGEYGHANKIGGKLVYLNAKYVPNIINGNDNNTLVHELGHTAGLEHPDKAKDDQHMNVNNSNKNNAMWSNQTKTGGVPIDDKNSTELTGKQIETIIKKEKSGQINKD